MADEAYRLRQGVATMAEVDDVAGPDRRGRTKAPLTFDFHTAAHRDQARLERF